MPRVPQGPVPALQADPARRVSIEAAREGRDSRGPSFGGRRSRVAAVQRRGPCRGADLHRGGGQAPALRARDGSAPGLRAGQSVTTPIEDVPTRTFEPGDVIFQEGDEAQSEAYLVHEGTVEAQRQVDGHTEVLNTLGKGDLLGEVALFRDAPHSVTAGRGGPSNPSGDSVASPRSHDPRQPRARDRDHTPARPHGRPESLSTACCAGMDDAERVIEESQSAS